MFGKQQPPQKKPFELTTEQIVQDIEALRLEDENQRNKLYLCLDNKPPQNVQLAKVEEFLNGNHNLENLQEKLQILMREVDTLMMNINGQVANIQMTVHESKILSKDMEKLKL